MHSQIKLGRIAGIQIGLHYSWFIIALLIAFSLASHFHAVRPEWNVALVWTCAIVTSIFFFVALLLHELAHSIVAKSRGLRVRAITLFALGGVSQIESEAADAKSEFWIAIVGPLTSLLIGAVLVAGVRFSGGFHGAEPANPIVAVALWLGYINIALAVFNMIPGYPLDGGRRSPRPFLVDHEKCGALHPVGVAGWAGRSFLLHFFRLVPFLRRS